MTRNTLNAMLALLVSTTFSGAEAATLSTDDLQRGFPNRAELAGSPAPASSAPLIHANTTLSLMETHDEGPIYENVELVQGFAIRNTHFRIDAADSYVATLTDLLFPAPLARLGLSVATPGRQLGTLSGAGSVWFEAEPGDYFLSLFVATDTTAGLGQYGISIMHAELPAAVPVPPALLLFGSGLLGLMRTARRPGNTTSI